MLHGIMFLAWYHVDPKFSCVIALMLLQGKTKNLLPGMGSLRVEISGKDQTTWGEI